MKHYVAKGDGVLVFEGKDARDRAVRFAARCDQGDYQGPLNLRENTNRWLTARGWRNVYKRMWRNS